MVTQLGESAHRYAGSCNSSMQNRTGFSREHCIGVAAVFQPALGRAPAPEHPKTDHSHHQGNHHYKNTQHNPNNGSSEVRFRVCLRCREVGRNCEQRNEKSVKRVNIQYFDVCKQNTAETLIQFPAYPQV